MCRPRLSPRLHGIENIFSLGDQDVQVAVVPASLALWVAHSR